VQHRGSDGRFGGADRFDDAFGLDDEQDQQGTTAPSAGIAESIMSAVATASTTAPSQAQTADSAERRAKADQEQRRRLGMRHPRAARVAELKTAGKLNLTESRQTLFSMAPYEPKRLVEQAVLAGTLRHAAQQTFDDGKEVEI